MASDKYSRDSELDGQDDKRHPGRFSRSQTFDFIREYRKHECLWNVGIPDYNDKAMRCMALRQLAKEFQLTLEAVKKKIHALRSTYLQMRDRVNEVENQEPTLSWYYEMEFLDPVITPRKPMELKRIRSRYPRKRAREEIEVSEEDEVPEGVKMEELPYEENTVSEQEEVYIEYIEQSRDESCGDVEVEAGTLYASLPENSESPTTSVTANPLTQDEFDVFGQSVAAQLKTMPLVHAIPLMGRIQALISEFRMKSLTSAHK